MICHYPVPILNILRGVKESEIEKIAEVISNAGLSCAEITMNTPKAGRLIERLISVSGSKMVVGAGTVLNLSDLAIALDAGASFIVTPNINKDIIEYCSKNNISIYSGALTPTEVINAWNMGATMVKIFPASAFGPRYFRELKGPFDKLKLMAVGGVNNENINDFLENGADAVAVGGSIFKRELLDAGDYLTIENNLKKLANTFLKYKKK